MHPVGGYVMGRNGHLPVPLNVPLKPGTDRPRMAGYGPTFVFGPGAFGFLGPRLGGVRFLFQLSLERRIASGPSPDA
jgi:hypothetical protein